MACRSRFALYEPIEFIGTFLKDKLEWKKVKDTVAIHVPCSSKKMGIESAFEKVAGMCAHEVVPSGIPCCGEALLVPSMYATASLPAPCSSACLHALQQLPLIDAGFACAPAA